MPATLKLKTDGTNPCGGERKCDQYTEMKPLGCDD